MATEKQLNEITRVMAENQATGDKEIEEDKMEAERRSNSANSDLSKNLSRTRNS
jgi:hypothetical protein